MESTKKTDTTWWSSNFDFWNGEYKLKNLNWKLPHQTNQNHDSPQNLRILRLMATFGVIGLLCTGGMVEVDWFVGVIIVAVTFLHILSRAENIYEQRHYSINWNNDFAATILPNGVFNEIAQAFFYISIPR